jgi:poly-beta-1,6-N-acetyl-D-glucosamine N-deacetylase
VMSVTIVRNTLIFMAMMMLFPIALGAAVDRSLYENQVAVIMYHHVHETDQSSSTITPELFENQLVYLQDKGYHFISLTEFERFLQGGRVPNNSVLVTFDDGYRSFYTHAYPILRKMNIPSVNFIIAETLAGAHDYMPPYMTRSELVELTKDKDLFRAECHTYGLHHKTAEGKPYLTHPMMVNGVLEADDDYRSRIVNDTQACIRELDSVNSEPVRFLAYPYGAFTKQASELIAEGGIKYAFTIYPGLAAERVNRMEIPRINAGSPHIQPADLHKSIIRRIKAVKS